MSATTDAHLDATRSAPDPWLARLARIAHRHPDLALQRLARLEQSRRNAADPAGAADALYQRFYLLEHRGRALELQHALAAERDRLDPAHHPLQAARITEALGRLAYQQGEYQLAHAHWSDSLGLAEQAADLRTAVAARIGLAQVHYARAAWVRGRRLLQDAAELLGELDDSYLAAKLALNLGVGFFETGLLEDAERHFSHGLAAARRGQHREFEAEAHWQLARAALARGRMDWATADCRLALDIAGRLGHSWLEAAASRTWTEIALARGDEAGAIRSTRHGLALAERIHSRPQQSQAHLQLARLLQQQGDAEAALRHLWQHQALKAEIERLSLDDGAAADAPLRGEALLLQLSSQPLSAAELLAPGAAGARLARHAQAILGVDQVQFWWSPEAGAPLVWQDAPPEQQAEAIAEPQHGAYLELMRARSLPLALDDATQHPGGAALPAGSAAPGLRSRLELGLMVQGRLVGLLWLSHCRAAHHWSEHEQLLAAHLARLIERLLLSHALQRAMPR